MLVRTNAASHRTNNGHLAALVGDQVFANEFSYGKGSEIFGEGDEPQYVYQIQSGAVRTYKMLPDGRRQINSFHLVGDMFGFETGPVNRFSAEAIIHTTVQIIRRRSLVDVVVKREGGTKGLINLVTRNLQHAENHMLLLGRKNAFEKVIAFLREMDERQNHPDVMMLPMNRRDIADYLGLTVETVARALSILRRQKMLRFEDAMQRKVVLLNRKILAALDV